MSMIMVGMTLSVSTAPAGSGEVGSRPSGVADERTFCDRIAEVIWRTSEQAKPYGVSAAVVLPDGAVCLSAFGLADVEERIPMTSGTRMLSGSTGKTFVAMTVMYLVGKGILDLDAPISRYIGGEAFFSRLPNARDITVRQLLQHTSGLPDHMYREDFDKVLAEANLRQRAIPAREALSFILDEPPLCRPGTCYQYADSGYLLLGLIIEAAAGRSYYELLQEAILAPNHLDHTSRSDSLHHAGLAVGYNIEARLPGFAQRVVDAEGRMAFHPGTEWTGGGLVSTPEDLARATWLFFRGELLPGPYLHEVITPSKATMDMPFDSFGSPARYGLGTYVLSLHGHLAYGHGGWAPGYVSRMLYFPDAQVAVALQTNYGDSQLMPQLDAAAVEIVELIHRAE